MDIAKIFWSGRSQAVRLPKEFRFDTKIVQIHRHGKAIILEPIAEDWGWLDVISNQLDEDAVSAATEPVRPQNRPALDDFFKCYHLLIK